MRIIIVLALMVVLAIAGYFIVQKAGATDPGRMVNYALGDPIDGKRQLDVEVSKAMTALDPPPEDFGGNWSGWIGDHWELRDSSGQLVRLRSAGTSSNVGAHRGDEPDFFLTTTVRANETYTLDYIPVAAEGKRYRHTFTVPAEGPYFKRLFFTPVDGE